MLRWSVPAVFALCLFPTLAHATNAGLPGFSGKATIACGGCHAGTQAPTITITGPDSLAAGAVGDYTVTVTGATGATAVSAGIDIAADSTDAVLATDATTLNVTSNEVVQKAAVPLAANSVSFPFKLTAPASGSAVKLFIATMVGDGVDGASAADSSAATTKSITVTGGAAGNATGAGNGTGGGNGQGNGAGNGSGSGAGSGNSGEAGANWTGCSMGGHDTSGGPLGLALLLVALAWRIRPRKAAQRRAAGRRAR